MLKILVVDAQGGGIGRLAVSSICEKVPGGTVRAVGTNTAATAAMIKAGAHQAATGENAVIVGARWADVIVGPVGIVIADSLFGEITPAMAAAIGQSSARRLLIPVNHCENIVVGVPNLNISMLVAEAVEDILKMNAGKV